MEISLGTLKKIGVMILAFVLVLFLASIFLPYVIPAKVEPTPTPTANPVGEKGTPNNQAGSFAAALYTVNCDSDAAWLADYKSQPYYTTFEMLVKPAIWPHIFKNFIKTTATVKNSELFWEGKTLSEQIWKVDLTLDQDWPANPLPPSNPESIYGFPWPSGKEVTAYILVAQNKDKTTWEVQAVLEQAQAENMKKGGK